MRKNKRKISDQEFLDTIDNISKKLSYKFKFGYHEIEDMKQQITVFALEGLENYDYNRPLENFLWTHVRNRLFNYKRDNYQRPNKPCIKCELRDKHCANSDYDCTVYSNKLDCELYQKWYQRNNSKKNLMYLNNLDDISSILPSIIENHTSPETKELILFLDQMLYGEHRVSYLKLKQGSKITKTSLNKLQNQIKEFL